MESFLAHLKSWMQSHRIYTCGVWFLCACSHDSEEMPKSWNHAHRRCIYGVVLPSETSCDEIAGIWKLEMKQNWNVFKTDYRALWRSLPLWTCVVAVIAHVTLGIDQLGFFGAGSSGFLWSFRLFTNIIVKLLLLRFKSLDGITPCL